MAVGFTLRFKARSGRESDFEAFMRGMVEVVKTNDTGCLDYELYRSVDDPTRFAFFERWATDDDVKAHAAKPHFKEFERMREMLEDGPELTRHVS